MEEARVLIVDDHQLFADGLRKLLEHEFELLDTVSDGKAAVEAFQRLKPDLTLLDVGLPLLNGIETARQIKRISRDARVLFVSMHSDRIYLEEALAAGGSGYVLKQAAARELVDAIRTVLAGNYYVSPMIAFKLGAPLAEIGKPRTDFFGGRLTARQREVLQLIAEGKSMKEIGDLLRISVRTVEFHKNRIIQELGCRSTAELTRYAFQHGISVMEETTHPFKA
jgi:DNA-binding NarL/FixJ family response regulator